MIGSCYSSSSFIRKRRVSGLESYTRGLRSKLIRSRRQIRLMNKLRGLNIRSKEVDPGLKVLVKERIFKKFHLT